MYKTLGLTSTHKSLQIKGSKRAVKAQNTHTHTHTVKATKNFGWSVLWVDVLIPSLEALPSYRRWPLKAPCPPLQGASARVTLTDSLEPPRTLAPTRDAPQFLPISILSSHLSPTPDPPTWLSSQSPHPSSSLPPSTSDVYFTSLLRKTQASFLGVSVLFSFLVCVDCSKVVL